MEILMEVVVEVIITLPLVWVVKEVIKVLLVTKESVVEEVILTLSL